MFHQSCSELDDELNSRRRFDLFMSHIEQVYTVIRCCRSRLRLGPSSRRMISVLHPLDEHHVRVTRWWFIVMYVVAVKESRDNGEVNGVSMDSLTLADRLSKQTLAGEGFTGPFLLIAN
jgi:hypothetical protein